MPRALTSVNDGDTPLLLSATGGKTLHHGGAPPTIPLPNLAPAGGKGALCGVTRSSCSDLMRHPLHPFRLPIPLISCCGGAGRLSVIPILVVLCVVLVRGMAGLMQPRAALDLAAGHLPYGMHGACCRLGLGGDRCMGLFGGQRGAWRQWLGR